MWWGLLALILTVSGVVMLRYGPVAALGCGVLMSFLFPCWISQKFMGVSFDLRISTSMILLLVNLVHPQRKINWHFNAGDWAVLVLYSMHVASDVWQDGIMFSPFARAFGEWSVPYLAGRLAIQNVQDWRWLTGVAAMIATVCALWATTEAVTRVNIGETVFVARPADRTPPMQIRGGFKRAEGPTRHAIWFAMIQTLLLPWTIVAAYRGLRGDGPAWWLAVPACSVFGIMATISRGAILTALGVFYLTSIFCLPKLRNYLIIFGIVLACVGFIAKDYLLVSLEEMEYQNWGTKHDAGWILELYGKKQRLNTVTYRWLVLSPYLPAASQAGLLGYGTERTSTFPVNVPLGPEAEKAVSVFWSIDCEYLLLVLRFGWGGLAAFLAVCVTSIWRILKQSSYVMPEERIFPLAIAATLISVSFAFFVEWMPHDYGFLFLWTCGVANGPRLAGSIGKQLRHRRRSEESN